MTDYPNSELMFILAGGFSVTFAAPEPLMKDAAALMFGLYSVVALYHTFKHGDSDD